MKVLHLHFSSPYRFGVWPWWKHWFNWKTYVYPPKYLIQRAFRGWADCDIWSLDHYLNNWMPDALTYLKANKHGVPMHCFPNPSEYEHSDQDFKSAIAKWNAEMDTMIEGFRAAWRIDDSLYEKELGEYDGSRTRFEKSEELRKRDEQLMKDGLAKFVEHYQSLWD